MFHSMEDCTNFIFSLSSSDHQGEPIKKTKTLLNALKNPHEGLKCIHFAGSNGKGSTLNATREILMEHGFTVGAFVSPHLDKVNDRITINKIPISDEKFLQYVNEIVPLINGQNVSFFEVMMLIAFLHFANEKVDVALIEAGIGGRHDCTNVIQPLVSVITTVSLEHTNILGNSIEQIAYEKAGIIKQNIPVVVGAKQKETLNIIRDTAKILNAPCYVLGEEIRIFNVWKTSPQIFDYKFINDKIEKIPLIMDGIHQVHNASLAITAAKLFSPSIEENKIRRALSKTRWQGRFERVKKQVILDGAHNSEGVEALIETLKRRFPKRKYKFIFTALKDKDYDKSIHLLDQVAETISFTQLPNANNAKAIDLASKSNHSNVTIDEDWKRLINNELNQLEDHQLLIITGSLYFIAEVRKYILQKEEMKADDTKVR